MSRIRILIADDHAVVREGLARLISDQPDMRVVAQAANGHEALAASRATDPHIAMLDMRMPGLGGAAAIRSLRESRPQLRVLVLSMYEDASYRRAALAAGAHAYLGKSASSELLLSTLRQLHAGQPQSEGESDQAPSAAGLSAREQEIAEMIVSGRTGREIGAALGISKSSVDTYRARLARKLGADNRAALFDKLSQHVEREPP
ncbi:MAG TPA: response regulator transcription factor [Polyangiales bacterium]|nr:response regulator transcription factor [Polyangiales bacterium]